ncbi:hypothetical protein MTP99_017003 [Tenebrio molitor]|nr:hypothetical protein MTP99_017003 [Tenebrio molitor]
MYFRNYIVITIPVTVPCIEILALQLTCPAYSFVLVCVYRPPRTDKINDEMPFQHLKSLSETHKHLLIFGDFNFPEVEWPISKTPSGTGSASLFVDMVLETNLSQMILHPTRYRASQNPSLLDLFLTTDPQLISSVNIGPPVGISDHATVECTVQIIDYCFPKIEKKIIRVVDYDHLNTYLNNFDCSPFYLLDDPDEVWEFLVGILNTAICLHSSYRLFVRNRQKPWITEKCIAKAKIKRNLWRRYKSTRQDVDFTAHRNYSNNLKCELVQARSRYENNLVSKGPKAIFKYTRSKMISKVSLPVVKDTKGSLCAKNQDTADCLASFFKSVYVNDTAQTIIPIPAGSRSKNALQDIDFPISAIKEELQRLKDSSSPGPDGIGCRVLKTNAETLAKPLHHLFSCSFSKSALPSTWTGS